MNKKIFIPIISLFLAFSSLVSCGKQEPSEPTKLAIISQPQSIEIENGDAMTMSVKVNNPKLVKSYQWYYALYDDGEYTYQSAIEGSKAQTDTYSLPAHYSSSHSVEAYQCRIIDIDGNTLSSDWGLVTTKPGKERIDQIVLGDYPILPGETLDLASTPYGSGTISLNEASDHFTFDNVYFTNNKFDSNMSAIGFSLIVFNPSVKNYIFEFKGNNHFSNTYWQEDRFEGGAAITINALDLDDDKRVSATFTGSGSVSFYGGTYGIISNFVDLIQDIDMTFTAQPEKYQGAIYCRDYTLRSNRTINVNTNRRAIDSNGVVTFEENSNVIANLNVAECGPRGAVDFVDTTEDIIIDKANIKISILLNVKKEIEHSIYVTTWAISGDSNVYIRDSAIYISIKEYNSDVDEVPDFFVSTMTSGGISGEHVEITNSTVNVEINGEYINEARAINCRSCTIDNSNINIDIRGNTAGGICCYSVNSTIDTSFICGESDININLFNVAFEKDPTILIAPYDNGGIYASSIKFTAGHDNAIKIKTNGIQTIALKTADSKTVVRPHEDYDKEFIKFDNATITSTKAFVHNEQSYSSASGKNAVYESLYEKLGSGNYKFLDNVVISY